MNLAGSAIHAQLIGGTALVALLGDGSAGVFEFQASNEAQYPAIIFQEQSAVWSEGMGEKKRLVSALYLVKAVSGSAWPAEADAIDAAVDARLHGATLTVTGYGVVRCMRESDIRYQEVDGTQTFNHVGGLYRVEMYKQ